MKKRYRIKKNETIKTILNQRQGSKDGYLSVYVSDSNAPHFRYAISVPKAFGTAVKRNKIKRQIRMIFQNSGIKTTKDIVVIVYPKARVLNYHTLKRRLDKLFYKLNLIEEV